MTEVFTPSALAGFKRDPIAFIERVLCDPETGEPFVLSANSPESRSIESSATDPMPRPARVKSERRSIVASPPAEQHVEWSFRVTCSGPRPD